jgi:hypothetical protein
MNLLPPAFIPESMTITCSLIATPPTVDSCILALESFKERGLSLIAYDTLDGCRKSRFGVGARES